MDPELSIGFPVFNGEIFLKKRLESILSQSFVNYELIISDNASTDDTDKICKEFLKKDSRIKYYRQEKNMGSIQNFKFVLDQAVGKYFVWAATDDLWENNFLEKTINVLQKNNSVVGCTSKVKRIGKPVNEFKELQNDSWIEDEEGLKNDLDPYYDEVDISGFGEEMFILRLSITELDDINTLSSEVVNFILRSNSTNSIIGSPTYLTSKLGNLSILNCVSKLPNSESSPAIISLLDI